MLKVVLQFKEEKKSSINSVGQLCAQIEKNKGALANISQHIQRQIPDGS